MPLQNKEIGFGDQTLACPNCGQSAIVNPFKKRQRDLSILPVVRSEAKGGRR